MPRQPTNNNSFNGCTAMMPVKAKRYQDLQQQLQWVYSNDASESETVPGSSTTATRKRKKYSWTSSRTNRSETAR
ncbi:unnamed protein product [Absidia cylindrospora]